MTVNNERIAVRIPRTISNGAIAIEMDGVLNEDTEHSAEVTSRPVEDGTIISDHIIVLPHVVKVQGIVSDLVNTSSQITDSDNRVGSNSNSGESRSRLAHNLFEQILNGSELCSIQTRLKLYTDMALRSVKQSSGVGQGSYVIFDLEFVYVRKVTSRTVQLTEEQIQSATTRALATPQVDQGRVETEDEPGSILFKLNEFINGD